MLTPSTLDYAQNYASLGMRVFPLHYVNVHGSCSCGGPNINPKCKPAKHPFYRLTPHGHLDASDDPEKLREWFDGKPYNIGLATGLSSGIFVLDRDDKDGGHLSLERLEATNSKLPQTLTQKTGNGAHYVFRMPADTIIRNSVKSIAPGLDIRGEGGYVVAAPSVHQNGNSYTWNCIDFPKWDDIAEAPHWLVNLVTSRKSKSLPTQLTNQPATSPGTFIAPEKVKDGEGQFSATQDSCAVKAWTK